MAIAKKVGYFKVYTPNNKADQRSKRFKRKAKLRKERQRNESNA